MSGNNAVADVSQPSDSLWPLLLACASTFLAVIPHVAGLMRPPLGQMPGLSVMINYTLCFSNRITFVVCLVLVYAATMHGVESWNTVPGYIAFQSLAMHVGNWYRFTTIEQVARDNADSVLNTVRQCNGKPPVTRCDDPTDELTELFGRWICFFTFAPAVVPIARAMYGRNIAVHRNIEYLPAGKGGWPRACGLDVMYSTDRRTYASYKQRPVAV